MGKKLLAVILILSAFTFMLAGCLKGENKYEPIERTDKDSITVVTFNCAAPWGNLLDGTASALRVRRFASHMNAVHPDIIGTQEMNEKWIGKLSVLMPDYESCGEERGGDENKDKSERNSIFWLKDKFELVEENTFWLSETPEKESRYSGAGCNRVCTYAVLKNKNDDETLIFLNTHLDNASEEAANFGAEVIIQHLSDICEKYGSRVILTGDFNETSGMPAYESIAKILNDSLLLTDAKAAGTYHDWGNIETEGGEPIDHIFTSSEKVLNYQYLNEIDNGYVSDHYGI